VSLVQGASKANAEALAVSLASLLAGEQVLIWVVEKLACEHARARRLGSITEHCDVTVHTKDLVS